MRLAVRKETFDSVINTNSEWLSMAKHVVAPIWNDILNKISSPEISDLCTEIKEYEVSLKLQILISLLCDNSAKCCKLSTPLQTICQHIKMHSKTFVWPSRHVEKSDDAISRVSSHNESYFSQYLTIKLYTVIRSKNLIQAFFHHGICLSYK